MMKHPVTGAPVKSVTMRAVVLDAHGKPKQDLGCIGYWHRNPLMRLWHQLTKGFRK